MENQEIGDLVIEMLHRDDYNTVNEEVEVLQEWESKLREWCFKFPEKGVCNTYFRAMMNEEVRKGMHNGAGR